MIVVDSSGWIEFFKAGPNGPIFKPAIEARHRLLHRVLSRALPAHLVTECLNVMRMGRVVDFTDARAIAAAQVARQYRLAMADAAMYSIAQEFKAEFWTQDVDYAELAGVRYCPKPPLNPANA
jgi:predicted nucleic acid-binding protein